MMGYSVKRYFSLLLMWYVSQSSFPTGRQFSTDFLCLRRSRHDADVESMMSTVSQAGGGDISVFHPMGYAAWIIN